MNKFTTSLKIKGSLLTPEPPRGKSLFESWLTTFLPDWQLPLILSDLSQTSCACALSNSVNSANVIFK